MAAWVRARRYLALILVGAFPAVAHSELAPPADPSQQVIALDVEGQLIAEGHFEEAMARLERRVAASFAVAEATGLEWSALPHDGPEVSQYLTALLNGGLAYHLWCEAQSAFAERSPAAAGCRGEFASRAGAELSEGLRIVTEALVEESRGDLLTAQDAYAAIVVSLPRAVAMLEDTWLERRDWTTAAALIRDFLCARIARINIAVSREGDLLAGGCFSNSYCREIPEPPSCPSANLALRALVEYVQGFRLAARDFAEAALSRPQHWVGVDPYEHPIFWIAFEAHRRNDARAVEGALSHRDELGETVRPDVDFILDILAGTADPTMPQPGICDTAGCRYFLAQALYAADKRASAESEIAEAISRCGDTESIMCTVVRHAGFKIRKGGNP